MNVCGSRIATRGPPGRIRPLVTRPPNRRFAFGSSQRPLSASATSKPALWRVPA